jgi:hypothetical protein
MAYLRRRPRSPLYSHQLEQMHLSQARCEGKVKFVSAYKAHAQLDKHVGRFKRNVYRCGTCHHWHIGSTDNKE